MFNNLRMNIVVLFAIFSAAFALPDASQRIIGGENEAIEDANYMVNVQFPWLGLFWSQACGGAIITPTFILSAAKEFYDNPEVSYRGIIGTSASSGFGGTIISFSEVIIHPAFNVHTMVNDIAMLRTESPLTLSATIGSVSIAGAGYILPEGTLVKAVGFGVLQHEGTSPAQLQAVNMQIVNHALCAQRYAYLKTNEGFEDWPLVTDGMACYGDLENGSKDACQGDHGGPVVHDDNVIWAVSSWTYRCGDRYFPGVGTLVSKHVDWIVSTAST